jgi:GNAT superfamily N-acetyltransferase
MPGVEVRIRRADLQDVPSIVRLSEALFREDAGSRDPDMNLEWAAQEGRAYFVGLLGEVTAACWLAEAVPDRGIVGYLAARLREGDSLVPLRVAMLESMYVHDQTRGRGVGTQLVEHFLSWAREQGAVRASVTAYATNTDAVRFYEREGFYPKHLSLERDLG